MGDPTAEWSDLSGRRVRLATVDDAEILARHRAAMFRDMGDVDDLGASVIENASADHLKALVEAREYFGFLLEENGEVIAGGGVWVRPVLPRPGMLNGALEGYVLNVYTEPGHRRRGLAREVMREILDWCRHRQLARVVLHASKDGRSLYEELGFEVSNEYRLTLG
jgi:GNAT superfamily N-acetyltransferase